MTKKTFLLIVPFIDDGGVEKSVANIANFIQSQKDPQRKVYVYALRKGNQLGNKFFDDKTGLFLNFWQVIRLCFRERKNIILFSALTPANIAGCFLSFFFGIRFFPSQQCVVYNRNAVKWVFLRLIYKVIYWQSTRFIAISEGIRDNLVAIIGKKAKIIKLYNPVLPALIHPVLDISLNPQEHPIRFCVLGRLSKQKGFDIIIKAFHKVQEEGHTNFHLTIAGNGEEEATLKQMVKDFKLEDRISFQGFVFDHAAYYSDKDYYLFPSRFEGLGLALIEAMNFGLPVIASDCEHGPSEILEEGKYGVLVYDIENIDTWTEILSGLLEKNTVDIKVNYTQSLSRFLTPDYIASLERFAN